MSIKNRLQKIKNKNQRINSLYETIGADLATTVVTEKPNNSPFMVYLQGMLLFEDRDYTIKNDKISFLIPIQEGARVEIRGRDGYERILVVRKGNLVFY